MAPMWWSRPMIIDSSAVFAITHTDLVTAPG
jgi:hypothetical protein